MWLSLTDAEAYSGLHRSTLKRHIKKGLTAYLVGGKTMLKDTDIDAYFELKPANRLDPALRDKVDSVLRELTL